MELDEVRLLIVVEDFDPSVGASDAVCGVDRHILEAATHWRSQLQEVAIYAISAPTEYNEIASSGVRLIGSGLPVEAATQAPFSFRSKLRSAKSGLLRDMPAQAAPNQGAKDSDVQDAAGTAQWPFSPSSQPSLAPTSNAHMQRSRIRPIADYCPTHLVICTPSATVISWATRNAIPSVVLLCDWREPLGWWQRWQHKQLVKQLNQTNVAWIGTHGAYACKILRNSGIDSRKLIPWEWPQPQLPVQYASRQLRYDKETYAQNSIELLYVGPMHTAAGVDDLLHALSHLRQRGQNARLQLICETSDEKAALGSVPLPQPTKSDPLCQHNPSRSQSDDILGDSAIDDGRTTGNLDSDFGRLKARVQDLNLTNYVTFTPALPEPKLLTTMRDADLVVMPGYDRNWPASTPPSLQLAMATRTPVIASDHEHFKEHLFHGVNAMIFPEGNAKSMAHRIERVMAQPQLYAQLSEALDIPLHAIKVPARWADLIDRWLRSDETSPAGSDHQQQLRNWAFSSGRYQSITPMQKPPKGLNKKA